MCAGRADSHFALNEELQPLRFQTADGGKIVANITLRPHRCHYATTIGPDYSMVERRMKNPSERLITRDVALVMLAMPIAWLLYTATASYVHGGTR